MGIETWLILLGVAVMTMIILDGKRKKLKKRTGTRHNTSGLNTLTDAVALSGAGDILPLAESLNVSESRGEPSQYDGAKSFEDRREGSHLGVATQIAGKVIAHESVSIKGRVVGAVIAKNQLIQLSPSSIVCADLEGGHICIGGHLDGDIHASDRLTLMPSATVRGTMSTNRFECHSGASVNGTVARQRMDDSTQKNAR
ncbi:bactofilin family protein [Halomonas sp. HL-93]|uniref:bactofilin family protein n=1 Tax=Halomonas sp. HL-93 TaxID=1666906 RepID=UPI0006DA8935|nr:polymer-forming cytoskeletal protein [Halomonas sp. HL-93]KPQ23685.1 MAG: bactofilin protein [Halomonas sp. HL-93]SBR47596.1 protein CcmA, bactofilin family [Halomonas sp. HL-93]